MGFLNSFFGKPEPAAEPVLPLPRATRTWPKAQPAPGRTAPAPAVSSLSAPPPPPAVRPVAPTPVRPPAPPAPAAGAVHEDTSIARMAPAYRKEASQVAQAFAKWKQQKAAAPEPPPAARRDESSEIVLRPSPEPPAPPARREDPVMHVARGAAMAARGEHDAAIAAFTRAIEIDPKCTTAWAARACSLEAKGDLDAARKDYAKSIDIELRQEIARQARPLG